MSRHGSLAEQLRALLAYRSRPEGEAEPIETNWTTDPEVPAPDDKAGLHIDKAREITPSINEIMREVRAGPVVRNDDGQVVAIGKLQFSDGAKTEKAYTTDVEGRLVQFAARMPAGAMLNCRERLTRDRGPSSLPHISNGRLAKIMGVAHRPKVGARRQKPGGRNYTRDESIAMLAEAIANTPVMPPVTKYPPGLPAASDGASECFVGMKKGLKGESGSIAWEDIFTKTVEREIWLEAERKLSKADDKSLDSAVVAKTMREIGESHGFFGKRAERMGKRILVAANDNLAVALREAAA